MLTNKVAKYFPNCNVSDSFHISASQIFVFLKKEPQGCSSFIPDQSIFCHTATYRNFNCVMPEGPPGQVIALMLMGAINFKDVIGLLPH